MAFLVISILFCVTAVSNGMIGVLAACKVLVKLFKASTKPNLPLIFKFSCCWICDCAELKLFPEVVVLSNACLNWLISATYDSDFQTQYATYSEKVSACVFKLEFAAIKLSKSLIALW